MIKDTHTEMVALHIVSFSPGRNTFQFVVEPTSLEARSYTFSGTKAGIILNVLEPTLAPKIS